jgi:hypothetical protein
MKLKLNNEQCPTKYFRFLISHGFFPSFLFGDKLITVLATAMVAYGNVPFISEYFSFTPHSCIHQQS